MTTDVQPRWRRLQHVAVRAATWIRDRGRAYQRWHLRKDERHAVTFAECGAPFHWTVEYDERALTDPPPEDDRFPMCHGAYRRMTRAEDTPLLTH